MTKRSRYPKLTGWPGSKELFNNPPEDFRPAAYWFWSNEIDPAAFRSQMEEMKNAGIHSLWIQPRLGFPMEKFMSPEYFELYRKALDIAIELDMSVGIYDDYNWITGHSGGRTVAENDELRERHTFWVEVALQAGVPEEDPKLSGIRNLLTGGHKEALTWLYEDGVVSWGDWEILTAFTYQRSDLIDTTTVRQVANKLSLVDTTGEGCRVLAQETLDQSATHLLVFITAQCKTSRMIDYLNPEATETFIKVGYEPYYHELRDYWDHIWAMFCDEPYSGLYVWDQMEGLLGTSLMYNEDFYKEFQTRKGYDIREHLYVLAWPADEGSITWRNDFFQVYAERVQRIFFEPLAKWSHDHDVLFVGHELMTQLNGHWAFTTDFGFDVVANFGADHFGIGELKDVSTTDSGSFDKNIAAKLASSVAHVYGKNGSMLEQYTPSFETDLPLPAARGDWDLTAQTLKQQMDFYAVQGLSQFLWHGYFHSNDVVGENTALYSQRFDFPPGINYEPWFRYFKSMSDQNARLAYFLSLGTHVAPAALLYPLRTYWSEGREDLFSAEGAFLNEYLSRLHCDFDFIDERNLLTAKIEGGELLIGDESYRLLVLPAVSTLQDAQVVKVIEDFVKAGGAVIFSGRIPSKTQTGADDSIRQRLEKLVAENQRVIYFADPLCKAPQGEKVLDEALDKLNVRSVSIQANGSIDLGSFYCLRKDEEDLYLAVLNDEEETKNWEIKLPGVQGTVEHWNLETGETMPWPHIRQDETGLTIYYSPQAIEAACFKIQQDQKPELCITDLSGRLLKTDLIEDGMSLQIELESNQPLTLTAQGLTEDGPYSLEVLEDGIAIDYDVAWNGNAATIAVDAKELASPHSSAPIGS